MSKGVKEHHLKTSHDMWDAVERGEQTAAFCFERGYVVGDALYFHRETPADGAPLAFGAQIHRRTITHIVRGPDYGIPKGYAILSLGTETPK